MKKQFTKFKIAAENLRSTKSDCKDFELETIEKQVDRYREVLEKIVRKLPAVQTATDQQERDKRIKKNGHYKIGQALEDSSKELTKDMPLQQVLANCGDLEKSIAESIVDSELETETEVVRRLRLILDNEIQEISTHKRNVSRTVQEYVSLKRNHETAVRLDEPTSKINSIKDQQEQCEVKLEKERDAWAAQMFELIAKEEVIVEAIRDYVLNKRNYHERALQKVNASLAGIQDVIQSTVKSRFGTSLQDHLQSTNRKISYIIELCCCCLLEHGLDEEGLLRVGCASTKLRRMKHALEAQYVKTPLPLEYQDPHVIASILKLYLRELPEPLLTFKLHKEFVQAAKHTGTENERNVFLKAVLGKLPRENYENLRYLTKFLWLVTQHVGCNKMNSQNLAIVMSPNMLWPRIDKSCPPDYLKQANSSSTANYIVDKLISQWDYFFEGVEVNFFETLQRHRLFVESRSKSGSSNENLDKHEGDFTESPRFGTIKRQKANAPSPPGKLSDKFSNHSEVQATPPPPPSQVTAQRNGEVHYHPHAKELFPQEKPEKPPLPKQLISLPIQHQQQITSQPQAPNEENSTANAATPNNKPKPMTRTQFFGLDTLPSPTGDRKSTDSVSSLTFKPDLPQKPKLPKRPMVLGLNANAKSDDESSPTNGSGNNADGGGGVSGTAIITNENINTQQNSNTLSAVDASDKLIEQLKSTENVDDNVVSRLIANNNHNQQLLKAEQSNALATVNRNSVALSAMTAPPPAAPSNADGSHQQALLPRITPTSPNTILTPKRPTVPAPPPPNTATTVATQTPQLKKQAD